VSDFLTFADTEEQAMLRDTLRRYLAANCPPALVRDVLEGRQSYGQRLWRDLAAMQCLGAAIPESYGGAGLGAVEATIVAEELGRVLAPLPILSTVTLFADLVMRAGSDAQKRTWLPQIAEGGVIATLADLELNPKGRPQAPCAFVRGGKLYGRKDLVADAGIADVALVLARESETDTNTLSLFVTSLKDVERRAIETIDPTKPYGRLQFDGAAVARLGAAGEAGRLLADCRTRAAVMVAFEQIGGAERVLERACDYARGRYAFGRPIGSFQAVKQLLADMYVSLRIAKANAAFAAFALAREAADLRVAAARAHFSATRAFRHCAADAIQVHGGAGFMWEVDMHLYFRRAELLAQCLGGPNLWARNLISAKTPGSMHV
jgi:alkylation response protein AidB-like acyl-CoA dehydrogenase